MQLQAIRDYKRNTTPTGIPHQAQQEEEGADDDDEEMTEEEEEEEVSLLGVQMPCLRASFCTAGRCAAQAC